MREGFGLKFGEGLDGEGSPTGLSGWLLVAEKL